MKSQMVMAATALFLLAGSAPSFADAMANFGTPPSGEIPILFNDHHVYAKPDTLAQNRVLAALVKNGTIMVPLRSMFEQMGATVSWNAASKTATAQKPGASVQVTIGKNAAVINGETRPLDVPPEIYKGSVVVPVRVMSESLGAYVQWVPDRRICVVRYIPPTPVPTAPPTVAPTAPPTPAPTPTPTPAPIAPSYHGFIQGAYSFSKISNEFAAQQTSTGSYIASGAYLWDPFAVKVDFRYDQYQTTTNGTILLPDNVGPICNPTNPPAPFTPGAPATFFNTIDGGRCFTNPFKARQSWLTGALEYKVAEPHIMIGADYLSANNNYGYPRLSGWGFGLEKLPEFTSQLSWHASGFYHPSVTGSYVVNDPASPNFGLSFRQQYHVWTYDVGLDYLFGRSPLYLYLGFNGDQYTANTNAPVNQTHAGPYAGIGIRF
ncbi:MAG TPA: copper amine oxidase N-terminal domain-containing protein [Candidatus Tumulicola sp.]|nr:copper amine oxidase N-terminal domain-containing protein [Candidatus Tumulicola sp.]